MGRGLDALRVCVAGFVSDREIQDYFAGLNDETKKELLLLPPEDLKRELRNRYLSEQGGLSGGWWGGRPWSRDGGSGRDGGGRDDGPRMGPPPNGQPMGPPRDGGFKDGGGKEGGGKNGGKGPGGPGRGQKGPPGNNPPPNPIPPTATDGEVSGDPPSGSNLAKEPRKDRGEAAPIRDKGSEPSDKKSPMS